MSRALLEPSKTPPCRCPCTGLTLKAPFAPRMPQIACTVTKINYAISPPGTLQEHCELRMEADTADFHMTLFFHEGCQPCKLHGWHPSWKKSVSPALLEPSKTPPCRRSCTGLTLKAPFAPRMPQIACTVTKPGTLQEHCELRMEADTADFHMTLFFHEGCQPCKLHGWHPSWKKSVSPALLEPSKMPPCRCPCTGLTLKAPFAPRMPQIACTVTKINYVISPPGTLQEHCELRMEADTADFHTTLFFHEGCQPCKLHGWHPSWKKSVSPALLEPSKTPPCRCPCTGLTLKAPFAPRMPQISCTVTKINYAISPPGTLQEHFELRMEADTADFHMTLFFHEGCQPCKLHGWHPSWKKSVSPTLLEPSKTPPCRCPCTGLTLKAPFAPRMPQIACTVTKINYAISPPGTLQEHCELRMEADTADFHMTLFFHEGCQPCKLHGWHPSWKKSVSPALLEPSKTPPCRCPCTGLTLKAPFAPRMPQIACTVTKINYAISPPGVKR